MILTKSNYMLGLKCLVALWIKIHDPDSFPKESFSQQYIMNTGIKVGELAQKSFPSGINAECKGYVTEEVKKTKELLPSRKPIFEAGFLFGNLYARVDIIVPVGDNEWDLVEVKSSGRVKEDHYEDVAFQLFVLLGEGIKIRKCYLMHIDTSYIRSGDIDYAQLFAKEDITSEVEQRLASVPGNVDEMEKVIGNTKPNAHCQKYSDCPVPSLCWGNLPEHNIFTMKGWGQKATILFEEGIKDIKNIPETTVLDSKQKIQKKCVIENKPYIDIEKIQAFLSKLKYPLFYLDFEACNPAVPLWDGTKPYQQVPFQFSIHKQESKGSELKHYSFIAETDDPRPVLIEALKNTLGEKGSIIVFYKSFELGRLGELAERYPEYSQWVNNAASRIVDLIIPFKQMWYYHPEQKGSASIKAVLPAVTGSGYEGLDIADGKTAGIQFLRILKKEVSAEEAEKIRKDLEEYCALDTEGMVMIINALNELG